MRDRFTVLFSSFPRLYNPRKASFRVLRAGALVTCHTNTVHSFRVLFTTARVLKHFSLLHHIVVVIINIVAAFGTLISTMMVIFGEYEGSTVGMHC